MKSDKSVLFDEIDIKLVHVNFIDAVFLGRRQQLSECKYHRKAIRNEFLGTCRNNEMEVFLFALKINFFYI